MKISMAQALSMLAILRSTARGCDIRAIGLRVTLVELFIIISVLSRSTIGSFLDEPQDQMLDIDLPETHLREDNKKCDTYQVQEHDTCHTISMQENVATFALLVENFLPAWCSPFPGVGTLLCLPATCEIYTVKAGDDCDSIAAEHGLRHGRQDVLDWNENLNALCNNLFLMEGYQICISEPGSTQKVKRDTPAIDNVVKIIVNDTISRDPCAGNVPLPSTCWTNQGPTTTPWNSSNATSVTGVPHSSTIFPSNEPLATGVDGLDNLEVDTMPVAKGTSEECAFYTFAAGIMNATLNKELGYPDKCDTVAKDNGVQLKDLLRLNPSLPGSGDCSLVTGLRYCVLKDFENIVSNGTYANATGLAITTGFGNPSSVASIVPKL